VQTSVWNSAELVQTLIRLGAEGAGEVQARAHELLDRGCKSNPELMLIGLIQIEVSTFSYANA
jgi:CCR4-NOT transcription complex subunit 1